MLANIARAHRYSPTPTTVSPRAAGVPGAGGTLQAVEAAFFDLDKTVIAKSSVLAFGRPFYREGLLSRSAIVKSAYAQVIFMLDRVAALATKHPEWKTTEPFKSILADDKEATAAIDAL